MLASNPSDLMSQSVTQPNVHQRIAARCHEVIHRASSVLRPANPLVECSVEGKLAHPPLPYPSSIISSLVKMGVSSKPAELISLAYLRNALSLRIECERLILKALRACIEISVEAQDTSTQLESIYNIFLARYRQGLIDILSQVFASVREQLVTPKAPTEKKTSFDKGVISILEKSYSRDPFPSSEDKRMLAHQTKLSPEQVRIWFQNRRARARRCGQAPSRTFKSTEFVTCSSIDASSAHDASSKLEIELNSMIDRIKSSDSAKSTSEMANCWITTSIPQSSALWSLDSPEHAFPTPYRPVSEPSQVCSLANFDIPWIRDASWVHAMVSPSTPNTLDLASTFSKLSISYDSGVNRHTPSYMSQSLSPIHSMWIPAKSAPLPPVTLSVTASHNESRSPRRKLSARSSLQETTARGTSMSRDSSSRTKPYPRSKPQPSLPRRIPQSQPQLISYCRSLSRSQSSRSLSASSFASEDSCSSYGSSSDSELGTPPPVSTDLPIYISEKESPSFYPCPISLPKLSKAFPKSPIAPRTYTFRTTIASS